MPRDLQLCRQGKGNYYANIMNAGIFLFQSLPAAAVQPGTVLSAQSDFLMRVL